MVEQHELNLVLKLFKLNSPSRSKLSQPLILKVDILQMKFQKYLKVDDYMERIYDCLTEIGPWCQRFLIQSRGVWWDTKAGRTGGTYESNNRVIRGVLTGISYVKYNHKA